MTEENTEQTVVELNSAGMIVNYGQVRASNGTVALPAYSWQNDPNTGWYWESTGNIVFSSDGARAATISGTSIIVGSATAAFSLASGTTDGAYMQGSGICNASADGNAVWSLRRRTSGGRAINLYMDTNIVGGATVAAASTSWDTSSDARIKLNFRDFGSGAILDALPVYMFDWTEQYGGGVGYGVKAQEAQPIFPQAITVGVGSPGDEDFQPWGADYSKYVPLLLREVKMLRQRVDALESND